MSIQKYGKLNKYNVCVEKRSYDEIYDLLIHDNILLKTISNNISSTRLDLLKLDGLNPVCKKIFDLFPLNYDITWENIEIYSKLEVEYYFNVKIKLLQDILLNMLTCGSDLDISNFYILGGRDPGLTIFDYYNLVFSYIDRNNIPIYIVSDIIKKSMPTFNCLISLDFKCFTKYL